MRMGANELHIHEWVGRKSFLAVETLELDEAPLNVMFLSIGNLLASIVPFGSWVIFPKYRSNCVSIYFRVSATESGPNCLAWHTKDCFSLPPQLPTASFILASLNSSVHPGQTPLDMEWWLWALGGEARIGIPVLPWQVVQLLMNFFYSRSPSLLIW